jgi:putative intracellular protease/amidase
MKPKMLLGAVILFCGVYLYVGCRPISGFFTFPAYKGQNHFKYPGVDYDSMKKTIVIVCDNDGTEIFDMLAPFYLFNATGKANVLLVAKKKYPIIVRKGFFTLPHYTFSELDSLKISPSVLVIPALSPMDRKHQDPEVVQWIRRHAGDSTSVLSICVGALTAAETGLFDGKTITTHASELQSIQKQYKNVLWTADTAVTKAGNLYSTAGVSNAVEGSLVVIRDLFGDSVLNIAMKSIHYPYPDIRLRHESKALAFGEKFDIAAKVYLKKNKKIGVLLTNDINEFQLAVTLDTYHRTFPAALNTFTIDNKPVLSKFGLILIPGSVNKELKYLDELHHPPGIDSMQPALITLCPDVLAIPFPSGSYLFDHNLNRIKKMYGKQFATVVKMLLDYN